MVLSSHVFSSTTRAENVIKGHVTVCFPSLQSKSQFEPEFNSHLSGYLEMSNQNTITSSNGEILTGKLWRKSHSFFTDLPFYTEIPRMDEIAGPLQSALGEGGREGGYMATLVVRDELPFPVPTNTLTPARNSARV
jgi:hypothetical protein